MVTSVFSIHKTINSGATMQDTNPLKQYFRRPAVFLKLPSGGKGYPQGTIDLPENGEIPIYPMTAIDEITSKTPDALFNGTALNDLMKSCVPNIKDPWAIPGIDLNPLLVAIRAATHGGLMEVTSVCPSCNEDSKFDVNLSGILASFSPGDYEVPLIISEDVLIKFKSMSYADINKASIAQFQLQKTLSGYMTIEDEDERQTKTMKLLDEINEISFKVISDSIEYVKVPGATVFEKEYIIEYLRSCDRNAYTKIREYSVKLRESTDVKPLEMKCTHCSHEYEQPFNVNPVDFFA